MTPTMQTRTVFKFKGTLSVLLALLAVTYLFIYNDTFSNLNKLWLRLPISGPGQNDPYAAIHNDRITHLKRVCTKRELFSNRTYKGRDSLVYYYTNTYDFAYCKVPKAGCTFWTQLFLILSNYSSKEAFGIKRSHVHSFSKRFSITRNDLEMRNPRVILVSRDPYSRLYSGYIDKVFLGMKQGIWKHIRPNNGSCNPDISFSKFLRFIVNSANANTTLNRHWAPIYSICIPCSVNQYRLVKQETFSKDVESILNEMKIEDEKYEEITGALHDHRVESTLPGIIKTAYQKYSTNKDIIQCIGWQEVARRLWVSFQIQGYINKNIDFPENKFESKNDFKDHNLLTKVVLETTRDFPMKVDESKKQRHEALVNAYKDISSDVINGIKAVYRPDFLLFGYDENPPVL